MTQIAILSGIYADAAGGLRTSYPRNMVPVPKDSGINKGYLRPGDGIRSFATHTAGADRGGYAWNGTMYRVIGSDLVSIAADGAVTVCGSVGTGGRVSMDSSFDVLAIWAGGRLYYWNGVTLTQVGDPDLGTVIDGAWVAGYFVSTDGEFIIVTELNDPTKVNPLKYGGAESDPDGILAIDELRNEVYAFGRYTIEVFQNVGGDLFPFSRIEGAQVVRGIIGTHAYAPYLETWAFVGSARNEAPSVYLMGAGSTARIATDEIDTLLRGYSEAELSAVLVETRIDRGRHHLHVHLPDRCLVYDHAASQELREPVWFTLDSGNLTPAAYRARGMVWCYDKWLAGDIDSGQVGELVEDVSTHYGQKVGWQFGTAMAYNGGRGAIVHELELVALPGRVEPGPEPVVWASYSHDGETWSQERPAKAGRQGDRAARLVWRRQGRMANYRMLRFRGTSDAHVPVVRLEAQLEALSV